MSCWAQYPLVFFVFLGETLDSAETPFAKTEFWKIGKRYVKAVPEVLGDEIFEFLEVKNAVDFWW